MTDIKLTMRCPLCLLPDEECSCTEHERDYGLIRDSIFDHLNPPDGDGAEVAILDQAVKYAAEFIESMPCEGCDEDSGPCRRCAVLGRMGDERVDR